MNNSGELSIYEYWLTKDVWNLNDAISIITSYYVLQRSWDESDEYYNTIDMYRNKLLNDIGKTEAQHIFKSRTSKIVYYNLDDSFVTGSNVDSESEVKAYDLLVYLNDKGYMLPHEFMKYIGIIENEGNLNEKDIQKIDGQVCRGIARTLWDISPEITIEEMLNHKAIKQYGSGLRYSRDTTVRRWLSDVDPRKVKTGPKKK